MESRCILKNYREKFNSYIESIREKWLTKYGINYVNLKSATALIR